MKATGQEDSCVGKMAKCLICCGDCILRCFERIVEYINNAAYAYMAVTGKNFCTSAIEGMYLNLKHAAAFGSAKYFASALIFLGKFGVTMLNIFTFIALSKAMTDATDKQTGPIVFVALLTWTACEIWLTVFDQAIMGIMTSYAVDFDVNKSEPKRGPETFNNKREAFTKKAADMEEEKLKKRTNSMNTEGGDQEMNFIKM